MTEPRYDEDVVNLGYLKRALGLTDEEAKDIYKYVSRHYASKPQPPYYAGDTWIDGEIVYTCIKSRLVGTYNESDWVTESGAKKEAEAKNKVFLRQPDQYKPGDMWILQSDTDHKAGKKGEMLIATTGRLEYDEDDWVNMLGYGTIRSINEVANNINDALIRLGLNKESGIETIFYSDEIPTNASANDLWYVTDELQGYLKGKVYKYSDSTWTIIEDELAIVAFDEANEARLVADGKIQSFYATTEPTQNIGVGDIWTDTTNNKLYRYNGTKWLAVYDTNISEMRINLNTVTTKTTRLETDLGNITAEVTELETTTRTIEDDLGNVETDVIATKERVSTLEIDAGEIKADVSQVKTDLSGTQSQLSSLSIDVDGIETRVETAEGEIGTQASQISTINQNVSSITSRVSTAEGNISSVTQRVGSIESSVSTIEGNISTITQDISGITTRVANVEGDVSTITQDVSGITQRVTNAEGDITSLNTSVNSIEGRVTTAEGNITSITADVSGITTRVSNVEDTTESMQQEIDLIGQTLTEEGQEIEIDASENPAKIEVYGNTFQQTYEGNQLINFGNPTRYNGATGSFANDVLTVESNTQYVGGYNGLNYDITDKVKANPGKVLKFTCESVDLSEFASTSTLVAQIVKTESGSTSYAGLASKASNTSMNYSNYTIPSDTSNITSFRFLVYTNNTNTTVASKTVITKPMLQFGTTEKDYEPYTNGTAPNPDYPQEIVNIGSNINLFDEEMEQGSINSETGVNATNSSVVRSKNYIEIPDGVSKLRFIRTKVGTSAYAIGLRFYDSSKNYLNYATYNLNVKYFNIDIIKNAKYLRFVDLTNDLTNKYRVTTDLGTCNYTKHNIGSIDYKIRNKSIFGGYLYTATSGGATYTTNPDGTALINGTVSGTSISLNSGVAVSNGYTRTLKAGTYKLSGGTDKIAVQIINTTGATIKSTGYSSQIPTFTLEQDTECFIRIQAKSGETFTNYIAYPMCIESDIDETYEPYKEQIATIPLPTGMELCKIEDFKDYLYKVNNKWYKHKEIGKRILTGNETWSYGTSPSYSYMLFATNVSDYNRIDGNIVKSNYFKGVTNSSGTAVVFSKGNNICCFRKNNSDTQKTFYCTSSINSLENFKAFLAEKYANGNPVVIYYVLITPVEEEITDEETINTLNNIYTLKGINYIYCLNDLAPKKTKIEYYPNTAYNEYLINKDTLNITEKKLDSEIRQTSEEITSTVSATYITKTDSATNIATAKSEAISSANSATDTKLLDYSTTTQMNSAITQKANEITSNVSETYETKSDSASNIATAKTEAINSANSSTDTKLQSYSTTTQMNSAIDQKANQITSTVSETYITKTDSASNIATAKSEAIASANSSTDTKLLDYSTTTQMNTAITQKASEIELSVSQTYSTKTETTNAINNITIGGRNYALKTGTAKDLIGSNNNNQSMFLYNTSLTINEINSLPSGKFICSFDLTLSGDLTGTSGTPYIAVGQSSTPWNRVVVTETIAGTYHKKISLSSRSWTDNKIGMRCNYIDTGVTVTISNLKVEIGTKYTDWTPAPEDMTTNEELATVIQEQSASFDVAIDSAKTEVQANTTGAIMTLLNNGYLTAEQVNALVEGNSEDIVTIKQQLTQTITNSDMQIAIQTAIDGGVSYLKNTLFTINDEGLWIATNQDEFSAKYDNKGMTLYTYEEMIAKFDVDGATIHGNLNIEGELITPNLRMMNEDVSGVPHVYIHWIGG